MFLGVIFLDKNLIVSHFIDSNFLYEGKAVNLKTFNVSKDIISECIYGVIDLVSDFLYSDKGDISSDEIKNILLFSLGNIEISINNKIIFLDYLISSEILDELSENIVYYFDNIKINCKIT